jgi:hypothetical protein
MLFLSFTHYAGTSMATIGRTISLVNKEGVKTPTVAVVWIEDGFCRH